MMSSTHKRECRGHWHRNNVCLEEWGCDSSAIQTVVVLCLQVKTFVFYSVANGEPRRVTERATDRLLVGFCEVEQCGGEGLDQSGQIREATLEASIICKHLCVKHCECLS